MNTATPLDPKNSIYAHREGIKARLAINRDAVLKALKELGATRAVVEYCGSGDDGAIEDVQVFKNETKIEAKTPVTLLLPHSIFDKEQNAWVERLETKSSNLGGAIETLVYDWLQFEHGGWETDDGARGECEINVEAGTFTLGHYTYFTDAEYSEHIL
ncbi:MAG: hypothetical protein JST16_05430 [Bdellovibrionales bacterium]|nr:hypothetical protein [Bdellovibrionales bacterium]